MHRHLTFLRGDVPLPEDAQAIHGLAGQRLPDAKHRVMECLLVPATLMGFGPSQPDSYWRRSRCFHPDIPTCRFVKWTTSIGFHRGTSRPRATCFAVPVEVDRLLLSCLQAIHWKPAAPGHRHMQRASHGRSPRLLGFLAASKSCSACWHGRDRPHQTKPQLPWAFPLAGLL
jgi:hypothetical protein